MLNNLFKCSACFMLLFSMKEDPVLTERSIAYTCSSSIQYEQQNVEGSAHRLHQERIGETCIFSNTLFCAIASMVKEYH
jgi:hypothetical protein